MRLVFGALIGWFVDDDDPLWTPWRGVLLWLLVVAALAGIGYGATQVGWTSSGDSCPPAWAQAGDC